MDDAVQSAAYGKVAKAAGWTGLGCLQVALAAARPRCGRAEPSPALPSCLGLQRIMLQRRARGSGCGRQPDMIG